ncbi:hypothetical protein HMPREF0262_03451 [Clostridium sp. ATCC 29733]|nr:hypothetical protein HMPREF0262_03451 [Clostridium sp. ATCC 29733]
MLSPLRWCPSPPKRGGKNAVAVAGVRQGESLLPLWPNRWRAGRLFFAVCFEGDLSFPSGLFTARRRLERPPHRGACFQPDSRALLEART